MKWKKYRDTRKIRLRESIDRRGEKTKIPSRDSYFWLFAFAELVKYRITGNKTFGPWVKLKGNSLLTFKHGINQVIRKIEITGS